jgi:hypothetical protein
MARTPTKRSDIPSTATEIVNFQKGLYADRVVIDLLYHTPEVLTMLSGGGPSSSLLMKPPPSRPSALSVSGRGQIDSIKLDEGSHSDQG